MFCDRIELRRKIQEHESELAEYSRSTDLVNLESSSNPNLQRLQQLYNDLSDAVSQRIDREIRVRELNAGSRDNVANRESGGIVDELKRELLDREHEYETKRQIYKDDWPEMRDLRADIEERRRVLASEVDKYFEAASRRARAEFQSARQKVSRGAEAVRLELTSDKRRHLFSRQAPHPAGWLPSFGSSSCGSWNRTNGLLVQSQASLPTATIPQ